MDVNTSAKKVLISYNWRDRDDARWLFWLQKKLEYYGFIVEMKELKGKLPDISTWLPTLENTLGISTTHFVEHDPGCLTVLSYLQRLAEQNVQDKVLLIAGKRQNSKNNSQTLLYSLNKQRELSIASLDTKLVVLYDGTPNKKMQELPASFRNVYLK